MTDAWFDKKMRSASAYFDKLLDSDLHPQLATTLLRLCGAPKLKYIFSNVSPDRTSTMAREFDAMVVQALSRVLRCAVTDFDMTLIHSAATST